MTAIECVVCSLHDPQQSHELINIIKAIPSMVVLEVHFLVVLYTILYKEKKETLHKSHHGFNQKNKFLRFQIISDLSTRHFISIYFF